MDKQSPRAWARKTASWPFSGLREGAPIEVQVTTSIVRRLLNGVVSSQVITETKIGLDEEVSLREVVLGHVELDLVLLADLEQRLGIDLWPSAQEIEAAASSAIGTEPTASDRL